MLKYDFYKGWYLPSNGTNANVVLRNLDLNCEGNTFQVTVLPSKRWKMQTLLLPSDRKSGICHRMTHLRMLHVMTLTYIFNITNVEMWISRKLLELARNAQVWLVEVNICYRMVPLRMLYSWYSPKFSRSQIWNINISDKVRAIARCVIWLLQRLIFAIE